MLSVQQHGDVLEVTSQVVAIRVRGILMAVFFGPVGAFLLLGVFARSASLSYAGTAELLLVGLFAIVLAVAGAGMIWRREATIDRQHYTLDVVLRRAAMWSKSVKVPITDVARAELRRTSEGVNWFKFWQIDLIRRDGTRVLLAKQTRMLGASRVPPDVHVDFQQILKFLYLTRTDDSHPTRR